MVRGEEPLMPEDWAGACRRGLLQCKSYHTGRWHTALQNRGNAQIGQPLVLEILPEKCAEVLRLAIVGGLVGPGVAGIKNVRGHIGAGRGYFEVEYRVRLVAHVRPVQIAPQGSVQ